MIHASHLTLVMQWLKNTRVSVRWGLGCIRLLLAILTLSDIDINTSSADHEHKQHRHQQT